MHRLRHAIMHLALKLSLDGFELRTHSLFRSDPPYGEGSALAALPTVVGEAVKPRNVKVYGFPLSPPFPVASGEPPATLGADCQTPQPVCRSTGEVAIAWNCAILP
jgi:hypothetical protein